ncbi:MULTISPECIES: YjgN family protein [unclassified Sphingomonas]|uniref:YjgN family protein n=1 Tax=unclassified Sphingomonas TaxID=196159 RepID=UPI0026CD2D46
MTMSSDDEEGAFAFSGDWREFAPIAFTNLLLCIVTLGIYTFWARTRERRYLWSNTRFIDERLEWTGTALELLIGYGLAIVLFGLPVAALQFGLQALVLRGYGGYAAISGIILYFLLLYLIGVAIFRALRYRLSRTFWRGIRGGSHDQGLSYGFSYIWRTLVGSLLLGLLIPWSMVSLWNKRWNAMSFGPMDFASNARAGPIFARFLLFYLSPIAFIILFGLLAYWGMMPGPGALRPPPADLRQTVFLILIAAYLLFFVVLGLIALVYYAAYFREVIGNLTLGELSFDFTASTWDWLKLAIGNLLLVVLTLGIGQIFLGYRNWAFFIRHMRAYGEVRIDALTQSTTREPGQGEGLLDAFDVGAF